MFNPYWFRRPGAGGHDRVAAGARAEAGREDLPPPLLRTPTGDAVWVIYASQTGVAEQLAQDTCGALQDAGVAARLLSFETLDIATLGAVDRALFLVSTCDDGDPPDMAEAFCQEHMQQPAPLGRLRYGLLALGDSYYDEFCAFGRRVHRWLQASGARNLFEVIEMDDEDEAAMRRWHGCVGTMAVLRHEEGHRST